MNNFPKISIITCSYNQGKFIRRTIESVLSQKYPHLEHIIVDGMSNDETVSILNEYPHLQVIREPDKGQADALNKGFRKATGDILCFLNSDDTFTEETLHVVAKEFQSDSRKKIIMGRCRFIDENDKFTGVEHPSAFSDHVNVLAYWKGYTIPQPAVFWVREVYEKCGGMNEKEQLILDYDLFCKYSKFYNFHFINRVFANYRLHSESKTSLATDADRLNDCIRVSKNYWGAPIFPLYWKLYFSLMWYLYGSAFLGIIFKPVSFLQLERFPLFKRLAIRFYNWKRSLLKKKEDPRTLVYFDFTEAYQDKWIGPKFVSNFVINSPKTSLIVSGDISFEYFEKPLILTFYLDGIKIKEMEFKKTSEFVKTITLERPLEPGEHIVEIRANGYFVPNDYHHNNDFRPIAWLMRSLDFV